MIVRTVKSAPIWVPVKMHRVVAMIPIVKGLRFVSTTRVFEDAGIITTVMWAKSVMMGSVWLCLIAEGTVTAVVVKSARIVPASVAVETIPNVQTDLRVRLGNARLPMNAKMHRIPN